MTAATWGQLATIGCAAGWIGWEAHAQIGAWRWRRQMRRIVANRIARDAAPPETQRETVSVLARTPVPDYPPVIARCEEMTDAGP